MIARLPLFVTRNFRLKVIAILVACGMWAGVVYASDPPAIQAYTVHVSQGGVLHPGLVLVRPIQDAVVKVAGVASQVHSARVMGHLSAEADLSSITRPGQYQVPLRVTNTDSNVWIWSAPRTASVLIERRATRTIPIHLSVSHTPPLGYIVEVGQSTITPSSVTVTGPQTVLANLQAEVVANLSAVRISEPISLPVKLINTGGLGADLSVSPTVVTVGVVITSQTTHTSVGIDVILAGDGQPASGYRITALHAEPTEVTVYGPISVLTSLQAIDTEPVDVSQLTSSRTINISLVAPDGTTLSQSVAQIVITVVPLASPSPTPPPTPTPSPSP